MDVSVEYEATLRSLWLLDLRGTADKVVRSGDEDFVLRNGAGALVYRQIKKRETASAWALDDKMRGFLEHAYIRHKQASQPVMLHEFYTNGVVSDKLGVEVGNLKELNSDNSFVAELLGSEAVAFSRSVRFYDRYARVDPQRCDDAIERKLREVVENSYGQTALESVTLGDVRTLVEKLKKFQHALQKPGPEISWAEVDEAVGLDEFLSEIERSSVGRNTLMPWKTAVGQAEHLRSDVAQAVAGLGYVDRFDAEVPGPLSAESPRQCVEQAMCEKAAAWIAGDTGAPELLLLVGAHGTGKTWVLMRFARLLAERFPGIDICVTAADLEAAWNDFVKFGRTLIRKRVLIIDDALAGWYTTLAKRLVRPANTLYVCAAATTAKDARLVRLVKENGGTECIFTLPASVSEPLIRLIAGKSRQHAPTNMELRRCFAMNIRQARLLLEGRVGSDSPELEALLERAPPTSWEALRPVLFCSSLHVAVPRRIVEKLAKGTVEKDISAWLIGVTRDREEFITIENADEADRILESRLGTARSEMEGYAVDQLLDNVDPEQASHRRFVRRLVSALEARRPLILKHAVRTRKRVLRRIIEEEPSWAVAFVWMPAVQESDELIDVAVARLTKPPETVSEFSIWLQAYGFERAHSYLRQGMLSRLTGWDATVVVRTALMITKLPWSQQRQTARLFCDIWTNLPSHVAQSSLLGNDLTTIVSLHIEHGRAWHRRDCADAIGFLFVSVLERGESIPQHWRESYFTLVDRIFLQRRHSLSKRIFAERVSGTLDTLIIRKEYQKLHRTESSIQFRTLSRLVPMIFDSLPQSEAIDDSAGLSGKALKMAARWGDDDEWRNWAEHYIEALRALKQRGVPFDPIAASVLPGFLCLFRSPQDQRARFLAEAVKWIPKVGEVESENTTDLAFAITAFAAQQDWLDGNTRDMCIKWYCSMATDERDARSLGFNLFSKLGGGPKLVESLGIVADWRRTSMIPYLSKVREWFQSKIPNSKFGDALVELWGGNPGGSMALAAVLINLGAYDRALEVALRMKTDQADYIGGWLLCAAAHAGLRSDTVAREVEAYVKFADTREQGGAPWLIGLLHRQLSKMDDPQLSIAHALGAELMRKHRLRPLAIVLHAQ